jgi:hypothetical protein
MTMTFRSMSFATRSLKTSNGDRTAAAVPRAAEPENPIPLFDLLRVQLSFN